MHWLTPGQPPLPQYLRLSAQDALPVPKSHLREPLLGGRTTQRSAAIPAAGELLPTEPGFAAHRQVSPGSPHPWRHAEHGAAEPSRDYAPCSGLFF